MQAVSDLPIIVVITKHMLSFPLKTHYINFSKKRPNESVCENESGSIYYIRHRMAS